MTEATHKARTLRGIYWNFLRVFSQTFLSLGVGVVLARLLPPADFGLLALAMVFVGFAELVAALGMGPALVRLAVLTPQHLQVATSLALLIGSGFALLLVLGAEWLAQLFATPALALMLSVLALGLWLTALAAVSRGQLLRAMDFRRLYRIDLIAYLVGYAGVSVPLALLGFGVWSLVLGTVTQLSLSAVMLLWHYPPHRPGWGGQALHDLLGFGVGVSANNTVNYLAANVDYLVIGKFLDATALGLYTRAYQLVTFPLTKIAATLSGVLFPAYAEIQQDQERLRRAYLLSVNAVALLTFPLLASLAVTAEVVIVGLYGGAWQVAAPSLAILALAGMFKAIFHLAGPVAQATGHIGAEVRRQTVYLLTLGIGCWLAVPYGIEAVAGAVVLGSLWLYLSMAQLVLRILGLRWRTFFLAQVPGVLVALLVALAQVILLWFIASWGLPKPVLLGVCILWGGGVLLLSLLYLPRKWLGAAPTWLVAQMLHRLPPRWQPWLQRRGA